jgi:hypothetical protein
MSSARASSPSPALRALFISALLYAARPALASAAFPPTDSTWARSPAPGVPVLNATLPWEGACVCENVALYDASRAEFVMFYRGGWGTQMVGRATSTDALTWTKHATPVFAAPAGAIGGQPWIHREGADLSGTLRLYTTDNNPPQVFISSSTDGGFTWTAEQPSIALPPTGSLWGNRVVWREGATWLMLQEVMAAEVELLIKQIGPKPKVKADDPYKEEEHASNSDYSENKQQKSH